jgi:hypothetical protein
MNKDYKRWYKDNEYFEVGFGLSRYNNGFDNVSDKQWDNIIEMVKDFCSEEDNLTQLILEMLEKKIKDYE